MPMLSLKDRIDLLEKDILASPRRISVYNDLPFAILRYDPKDEWELRKQVKLLSTRVKDSGTKVSVISLSELLWEAVEKSEGINAIVELEKQRGFEAAQDQITLYLSDSDWCPFPDLLLTKIAELDPPPNIVFLCHSASLSPSIYQMSKLLDEMQGRTLVPIILFYPGTITGTTGLKFMGLKDRDALGNYRVKIYG